MDKEDVVYIHTMEYYSAIKKKRNLVICDNMDGYREYYAKWNKSDKDRYHMFSLIQNKNIDTENKHVVARGKGRWRERGEGD